MNRKFMNNSLIIPVKKKILITHPWFLPAYKAGGPIQSLANLCRNLKNEYSFFILCNDKDHMDKQPLTGIVPDEWNDFENSTAQVFYISASNAKFSTIRKIVSNINPDFIFINGIYSPLFTLGALLSKTGKKILSVRGMLHPGALSQKSFKKKIYLSLLKLIGVKSNLLFHATDIREKEHIHTIFGKDAKVMIAQNFPNQVSADNNLPFVNGVLKIVSIALISPMKNHAMVLEGLKELSFPVEYDIYGPIKDAAYWEKCIQLIGELPSNIKVNYKGSIEPAHVANVLQNYHYLVQPSKSENFGHSIYEALSCGLPIITSHFTPWNQLEEKKAGWNIDLKAGSMKEVLNKAFMVNKNDYAEWSRSAKQFARNQINLDEIRNQYKELFH